MAEVVDALVQSSFDSNLLTIALAKLIKDGDMVLTCPYTATAERKPSRPGCWDIQLMSIFDGDTKIGEYKRLYSSFGVETFAPFVAADGQWYALYSADYTCTRVMRLPSCEDIGGEDGNTFGFCPTALYVPRKHLHILNWTSRDGTAHSSEAWLTDAELDKEQVEVERTLYLPWGFVSGCIWGDDSSWKVECFNLTQAHEGVIKRFAPYGYAELPRDIKLKDAIDLDNWEPDRDWIGCKVMRTVNMAAKFADPEDKEAEA